MMQKNDIRWEKIKKCPLCKSKQLKSYLRNVRYWENDIDFNFDRCKKCGFIFVNPRPDKKSISTFYKSESYWGINIKNNKKPKVDVNKVYGPIYRMIKNEKRSSIFDLGAGTGLFLLKFKKKRWKIDGIEYSLDAVKFAKKVYQIDIKQGDFLDIHIKDVEFGYVVLNNVLEHLHKPLETLIKVRKMISDDGVLIIAVPNIDSLGYKIYKKNWYPLQPPIHLNQFNPKTIDHILKSAGFKIVKISHKYPEHAYFGLFESYRSLFSGRNKKKSEIVVDRLESAENNNKANYIKEAGIFSGKIISHIIANLGYVFRKGENIIVYAEKA